MSQTTRSWAIADFAAFVAQSPIVKVEDSYLGLTMTLANGRVFRLEAHEGTVYSEWTSDSPYMTIDEVIE